MSEAPLPTKRRYRGSRWALLSLVFGFLALGTAVYRSSIEAEPPTPTTKEKISDAIVETLDRAADKMKEKFSLPGKAAPASEPVWPMSKKLAAAASALGFCGAFFGCVSWLVGEHRRWTLAAICISILALAWTHVVVAVSVAVAVAVLLWFLQFVC